MKRHTLMITDYPYGCGRPIAFNLISVAEFRADVDSSVRFWSIQSFHYGRVSGVYGSRNLLIRYYYYNPHQPTQKNFD